MVRRMGANLLAVLLAVIHSAPEIRKHRRRARCCSRALQFMA